MTNLLKHALVGLVVSTVAFASMNSFACSGHKKHHQASTSTTSTNKAISPKPSK